MWELIREFYFHFSELSVFFSAFSNYSNTMHIKYSVFAENFYHRIQFTLCHNTHYFDMFYDDKKTIFIKVFGKKCQKHNINQNNLRNTARENTRFYKRLHILCNLINNISHRMFPINLISS